MSELYESLKDLKKIYKNTKDQLLTEEATKTGLIMRLLRVLGYDILNPLEVVPEFIADIGKKKGEKVDFAIKKDDEVALLIECKPVHSELTLDNATQLVRYFNATDAKFSLLTNGRIYRFYTDFDKENIMDSNPFFVFDLEKFNKDDAEKLGHFSKESFDYDKIRNTASDLKYLSNIKKYISQDLSNPSETIVRHYARDYDGKFTSAIKEKFTLLVKEAFNQTLIEKVNKQIDSFKLPSEGEERFSSKDFIEEVENLEPKIVETEAETQGYYIVKAILSEVVDLSRIHKRDTQSYFGILYDNTNRQPICRLHFNRSQKYIELFKNKVGERVAINSLEEIYNYASQIKSAAKEYADEAKAA